MYGTKQRNVACRIGSHSVSCYPTQVNAPRLNYRQTGRYSILPTLEGWKAELNLDGLPAHKVTITHPSSNHLIVTRLGVEPATSLS